MAMGLLAMFLSLLPCAALMKRLIGAPIVAGAVGGVLLARARTGKWERDIRQGGELTSELRGGPWWVSPVPAALLVFGVAILWQLPGVSRAAGPLLAVVAGGIGTLLLTAGGWMQWWGRKMERQLGKPLLGPIRRA
jgi:hypothetical protein